MPAFFSIQTLTIVSILCVFSFFLGKYWSNLMHGNSLRSIAERNDFLLNQLKTQKNDSQSQIDSLSNAIEEIRNEKDFFRNELTRKELQIEQVQSSFNNYKIDTEKLENQFSDAFENLANKILTQKADSFTQHNRENLHHILHPLQQKISHFEKKIEQTHKESIGYHAALRQQLIGIQDLNQQMSKEAINLTKALKGDPKIQGNWGELVLERVLEKSGLEKDREYKLQKKFVHPNGSMVIPDAVIYLPDQKKMVIDSKVTLTAYERYSNADDAGLKTSYLKQHVSALQKHVNQLAEKSYQSLYPHQSPDFVLLFVPIETAFAVAINQEPNLYAQAFEKNIVITTPTTLLATLKTIDSIWNNEKQQQHAHEIARQAGGLYDKFEGLLNDLMAIGKKINETQYSYDAAINKLVKGKGNLIGRVENLKKMGAKAKKTIPESFKNYDNDLV